MLHKISEYLREFSLKLGYDFSSIQVQFPDGLAQEIYQWGLNNIPDNELIHKGRETDIHVTLKYGLHNHDPFEMRSIVAEMSPLEIELGLITVFENEEEDVIKIDVISPKLIQLNKKVCALYPNTETHSEYIPHCTVAYVEPGLGKKYSGRQDFFGRKFKAVSVTFSGNDNRKTELFF